MGDERIKIVLSGALGRMGQALSQAASLFPEIEIVGALETAEKLAGQKTLRIGEGEVPAGAHLSEIPTVEGSTIIDFSSSSVTSELARHAPQLNAKLVVGTTGLSDSDLAILHEASRTTAVLVSSNMSLGVQVLLSVIEQLSKQLADFDIEIVEMHHRRKKDAPSGTALMLADAAARAREHELSTVARHGRHGFVGERTKEELGLHAVRGGDIVGEHIVIFAGEGEHLELRHSAHSRMTFAMGALRAALFLRNYSRGYFTMRDVLLEKNR